MFISKHKHPKKKTISKLNGQIILEAQITDQHVGWCYGLSEGNSMIHEEIC